MPHSFRFPPSSSLMWKLNRHSKCNNPEAPNSCWTVMAQFQALNCKHVGLWRSRFWPFAPKLPRCTLKFSLNSNKSARHLHTWPEWQVTISCTTFPRSSIWPGDAQTYVGTFFPSILDIAKWTVTSYSLNLNFAPTHKLMRIWTPSTLARFPNCTLLNGTSATFKAPLHCKLAKEHIDTLSILQWP